MNNLSEADLTHAAKTFALANTPFYLIRMLRQDPVVQEIRASFSPQEILERFRAAVAADPEDAIGSVRPYVYMVALALRGDISQLKEAVDSPRVAEWAWLEYIGRVLAQSSTPLVKQTFHVPAQMLAPSVSAKASAPVETSEIRLKN